MSRPRPQIAHRASGLTQRWRDLRRRAAHALDAAERLGTSMTTGVPASSVWRTLPRTRAAGVRGVAALAGQLGGHHRPLERRVEHDEVGRFAGRDRAAVAIGDSGDRRRLPAERGDDVGQRHVELGDRQGERGLEAEHPGRRLVERGLLRLRQGAGRGRWRWRRSCRRRARP